jgi:hypothetical protein
MLIFDVFIKLWYIFNQFLNILLPKEDTMQNLATDFHPAFATGEFPFIKEFDADANCYNMVTGPCCGKKWRETHASLPFIPIDEISEEHLHPDVAALFAPSVETEDEQGEDGAPPQKPDPLHPTDAWGIELPRLPSGPRHVSLVEIYADDGVLSATGSRRSVNEMLGRFVNLEDARRHLSQRTDRFYHDSHGRRGRKQRQVSDFRDVFVYVSC